MMEESPLIALQSENSTVLLTPSAAFEPTPNLVFLFEYRVVALIKAFMMLKTQTTDDSLKPHWKSGLQASHSDSLTTGLTGLASKSLYIRTALISMSNWYIVSQIKASHSGSGNTASVCTISHKGLVLHPLTQLLHSDALMRF